MLTLFAIPRPFQGHFGTIQRNAIASWTRLRPRPEVLLFGDEQGVAEIALEFGLRHMRKILRNKRGMPLVSDVFEQAQALAQNNLLCYINADVMVLCKFIKFIQQTATWRNQFLLVGRRRNVDLDQPEIYESQEEEARLRQLVSQQSLYSSVGAMDYFVFPRGLFPSVPPFTLAAGLWDNWLVWKARSARVPVVDASEVVFVVHQNHPKSASEAYGGEEGRRNRELAGPHMCSLEHATHKLTTHGIASNFWQQVLRQTRDFRHILGLRRDNAEKLMSKLGLSST